MLIGKVQSKEKHEKAKMQMNESLKYLIKNWETYVKLIRKFSIKETTQIEILKSMWTNQEQTEL